jgi:Kef-type K+ transport system membrane component KefB
MIAGEITLLGFAQTGSVINPFLCNDLHWLTNLYGVLLIVQHLIICYLIALTLRSHQ